MNRKNNFDLTEGRILGSLVKLTIPIMATSFIQMAYNLTDLLWIGRMGSSAVAAVGSAGFFTWFGYSLILISKIGGQVGVAQAYGRKDITGVEKYANNAIQLNIFLAVIYSLILIFNRDSLIGFFRLEDRMVVDMAGSYLIIVGIGIFFMFINPVFTGIMNGLGDSRTPFLVHAVGLILNMVLDPVLIFGIGPFPEMGVIGAAIATVFSQFVVTIIFIFIMSSKKLELFQFRIFRLPSLKVIKDILRIGSPVAAHSALFTIFAMFLARIVAQWGPIPIAVQKVGAHIEAISWMTAEGFSTALSSFIGQNFGAQKWSRIWKGYFSGIGSVSVIGVSSTILLVFFARPIFSIFIPENEAIEFGIIYLQILGLSQLFMCLEIVTSGAFNGIGRTVPPSLVGIFFTGLRVPAALILTSESVLGLSGVWWSISMSSVFKGLILTTWFIILLYKHPCIKVPVLVRQKLFKLRFVYPRDKGCIQEKQF